MNFEVISGPNDADGNTPATPDFTCTVKNNESSCTVTFNGSTAGTNLIRGWFAEDAADTTEGRDETTAPGATAEPDATDVVEKTWQTPAPATLDCDDPSGDTERETNPLTGTGSSETYTCTLRNQSGALVTTDTQIRGEVENGVNDPPAGGDDGAGYSTPDYSCQTGTTGTCQITVTPSDGDTGTAEICFYLGDGAACATEPTDEAEANDLADQVEKTWAARAASTLDAEPETDTNALNETHAVTVRVYDQFGEAFNVGGTQVALEFFSGSPRDTDGNTPAGAGDLTCTTAAGSSDCTISYTSGTAGTDLMCVYLSSAVPALSGNNTNGTCDAEALADSGDTAGTYQAPEAGDNQDVVQKVWQSAAGPVATVDASPETATNTLTSGVDSHSITVIARDAAGVRAPAATNIKYAISSGPNAGTNAVAGSDGTCQQLQDFDATVTGETHRCTYTNTTDTAGTDQIKIFADLDNDNFFDTGEPFDDVTKTWVTSASALTISPSSDSASVGRCNPFTVTLLDSTGKPVSGATIDVEQVHSLAGDQIGGNEPTVSFCTPTAGTNPSGVDEKKGDLGSPTESPDNLGTIGGETKVVTDAAGKVTFGIAVTPGQGSDGSGTVTVTAFYDTTDDDDAGTGEPKATATKTWVTPDSRRIDCGDAAETSVHSDNVEIQCLVTDRFGDPIAGEGVTFTTSGTGSIVGSATDTSDAAGLVTVTVTSTQAGTQTVTATLTDDLSGAEPGQVDECDRSANDPSGAPAGDCDDSVTVTWTNPPTQCSDGMDNDSDGEVDFPADRSCTSTSDDSETTSDAIPEICLEAGAIVGDEGDNNLTGTGGDDIICGLSGDDTISGLGGNDILLGGLGTDTLNGGNGNDLLRGGADDDVLIGGAQNDFLVGGGGDDILRGSAGSDTLKGGRDADLLQGGRGDDILRGGTGSDFLRGSFGNDFLNGGRGIDTCQPGRGNDVERNCER